ncbi:hypothetical protein PRIPAC_83124 [Pristionchus pacificus]|uniref:Major sperm protein n=1 Tax=Pristionchus pacificus TaxID=54126 RepID=A0A2A6BTX4_PRIPA|nr:hypothetical protein PRIPAC_83124 [Pristionchus pacificus]|eukprot:PDM69379.1 MSP domain-containing protein [Pristionchus pacificus]
MACLLLILSLCSVFTSCASMACTPLPALSSVPAGYVVLQADEITLPSGDVLLICPEIALAQIEANGPQLFSGIYLMCNTATKTISPATGFTLDTRLPVAITCVSVLGNIPDICPVNLKNDQGSALVYAEKPIVSLCPSNKVGQLADGTLFTQVDCEDPIENPVDVFKTPYTLTKTDGTKFSRSYYYNYGVGVHAYCADSGCISVIQKNGIGYDMTNGKGLLGRAISESQIGTIRAMCQTGSANLRNLGFTKSGNNYLHNLNGSGLKQGWVSTTYMSRGASLPIKRWKSRYTDDMMYGENLEWNTWYKGMVQDGGKVQFYMWHFLPGFAEVGAPDMVTNSSARRIGWAFKTTNMKRLGVDPAAGVLDPKENALIAVSCDAFAYRQEDTNNDRITIEWTNTPDGAAKQFRREWFQGDGMVRRKNLPIEYNP